VGVRAEDVLARLSGNDRTPCDEWTSDKHHLRITLVCRRMFKTQNLVLLNIYSLISVYS
jgi:hypothetical protein